MRSINPLKPQPPERHHLTLVPPPHEESLYRHETPSDDDEEHELDEGLTETETEEMQRYTRQYNDFEEEDYSMDSEDVEDIIAQKKNFDFER